MRTLRLLWNTSRSVFALACVLGLLSAVCATYLLRMVTRNFLDHPVDATSAVKFLGVTVVALFSGAAGDALLQRVSLGIAASIRMKLFQRLLVIPLADIEQLAESRAILVLTDDLHLLGHSAAIVTLVTTSAATAAAALLYMLTLSPALTAVALVTGPCIAAIALLIQAQSGVVSRQTRKETELLLEQVHVAFAAAKELRLSPAERVRVSSRSAAIVSRVRTLIGRSEQAISLATHWTRTAMLVLLAIVLGVGGHAPQLQGASLGSFSIALLFLFGPLGSLLNYIPQLRRMDEALGRIHAFRETLEAKREASPLAAVAPLDRFTSLELDGVHYRHPSVGGRDFTLGPIDLSLAPGQIIMIVGGNGSGKSTLGKVLCGLYPARGIELNGVPIDDDNRDWFSQHFTAVFVDYHLFHEVADEPTRLERANGYLKRFGLADVVRIENGRLSTSKLSTGQLKRLALVRAYLEDRPIYLFDEWAADQDPQFRRVFYLELLPELRRQGKTVVAITHDDRYFHVADRLIKMDHGRISSDGTAEFMARLGAEAAG